MASEHWNRKYTHVIIYIYITKYSYKSFQIFIMRTLKWIYITYIDVITKKYLAFMVNNMHHI